MGAGGCSGIDSDSDEQPRLADHKLARRFPHQHQPRPPDHLWDTREAQLLEMVKCDAFVRVAALDPKQGTFRVRMKCMWSFRTHNSREDAELHLRGVPGVRMPGLIAVVEESRVWKDISFKSSATTTARTVFWKGISLFTMDGFKAFQMQQFPFDRHILNLERLEFVWRTEKDASDYYKSMKIVSLNVETSSLLPEWKVYPAYVLSLDSVNCDANVRVPHEDPDGVPGAVCERTPAYASKFTLRLRIQRLYDFYIRQVFLASYLITILSCTPLGMHPGMIGDRLAVYSGGMLTLIAFKYSVSDQLPSVPYLTFADKFLMAEILTICFASLLALVAYRCSYRFEEYETWIDWSENILGCLVLAAWTTILLAMLCSSKPRWRSKWEKVTQEDEETQDAFARRDKHLRQVSSGGDQNHYSVLTRVSSDVSNKARTHRFVSRVMSGPMD